jgi:hypothetical protein
MILIAGLVLISCTKRKPEEIDYAPNSPWNPYPPDSSANIDHTTLDVTLRWSAYDRNSGDVLTYDVYLDTLDPPMAAVAAGLSSPNFFMTGLSYHTTYYWKVCAKDQAGTTTSGVIWRFTTLPHANTAPNVPSYLYPANGAAWQYPTLDFGVNCSDPEGGSDTLYYDLYLGITPQPPPTLFRNDPAGSWEYTGLGYTTTYYWRVAVRDNHYAYTSGPVYSFVTRDCPWFYKKELPSARYGFGAVVVNNKIYVIGGTDGNHYLNEVLEYDPLLNTWTRRADMPTPRSDLAVTVWNNKIYALAGRNNDSLFRHNQVYDPLLDAWDTLAPVPAGFTWATANTVGDKIYLFGSLLSLGAIVGEVYEYIPPTGHWWDTTYYRAYADTISPDSIVVYIDTIYESFRSRPPTDKLFCCSAVYDNLIYVMGGMTKHSTFPPAVDVYHPETNQWTAAGNMAGPASAPSAVVANGYIYVIGGYDGYASSKRVRRYDPFSDTWFIRSDLQKDRSFLGAAFINNRIYAIGGLSVLPLATMEEYRLDLDPKNVRR